MTDPLRLFIAIGVSAPEKLPRLPGALTAAHGISAWARQQGYTTLTFTDEPLPGKKSNPVTTDRLFHAIHPIVSDRNLEKDRVIVAFAGHGATVGTRDMWLLNEWKSGVEEVIDAERLRLRLETWGFKQICVIGDACRVGLTDAPDLSGTQLLRSGDSVAVAEVDTLFATGLGRPAFMARARGDDRSYCLFTQVVLDALCGRLEGSVDPGLSKVTSPTLRMSVPPAVARAANLLNQKQQPRISTGFNPPRDVYNDLSGAPPPGGPTEFEPPPDRQPTASRAPAGGGWSGDLKGFAPKPAAKPVFRRDEPPTPPTPRKPTPKQQARTLERTLRQGAGEERALIRDLGQGLLVRGDAISEVALAPGASDQDLRHTPAYDAVRLDGPATNMAVELRSNHCWVVASTFPDFLTSITVQDGECRSVIYRPRSDPDPRHEVSTEQAVAALQSGDLLDRDDVLDLAAWVREGKTLNPIRGVIAAALYARFGDIDNIRRIGWYFARGGVALPPDIVLLGRLPVFRDDGQLRTVIPATGEREPLTAAEAERRFTTRSTPDEAYAGVAGLAPWLRQSWDLLDMTETPASRTLLNLRDQLTHAVFTTLQPAGGKRLARLIQAGDL